jgi:magnesium-transporting ATPase (P-type)
LSTLNPSGGNNKQQTQTQQTQTHNTNTNKQHKQQTNTTNKPHNNNNNHNKQTATQQQATNTTQTTQTHTNTKQQTTQTTTNTKQQHKQHTHRQQTQHKQTTNTKQNKHEDTHPRSRSLFHLLSIQTTVSTVPCCCVASWSSKLTALAWVGTRTDLLASETWRQDKTFMAGRSQMNLGSNRGCRRSIWSPTPRLLTLSCIVSSISKKRQQVPPGLLENPRAVYFHLG